MLLNKQILATLPKIRARVSLSIMLFANIIQKNKLAVTTHMDTKEEKTCVKHLKRKNSVIENNNDEQK
jgi:hypothetical protein